MAPDDAPALQKLWHALLHHLLAIFSGGQHLKASHLAVAVQFLKDNGISARTMHDARAGSEAMAELDKAFDA